MRSQIVKRSFVIAGQKKSISLEEAVWRLLKEIATNRDVTLLDLLTNIASTEDQRNLSSAIRLFVLNFYREQLKFNIFRRLYRQYFAVLSRHCTKLEGLRGRADQRPIVFEVVTLIVSFRSARYCSWMELRYASIAVISSGSKTNSGISGWPTESPSACSLGQLVNGVFAGQGAKRRRG